jgi:hypothetical protein
MKKSVLSAAIVAAAAGTSLAQPVMETRFLVQTVTGSGATYTVSPAASNVFAAGATVRLTLQYRILDAASTSTTNARGLVGTTADIKATGAAGGTTSRSSLTGDDTFVSGEAYGAPGSANTDTYPYTGENADGFTGLHNAYRGGLSGGTPDLAASNGTFVGREVLGLVPLSLSVASFPQNTGIAGNPTAWFGLFSFNFTNSGAQGAVTLSFLPPATTTNPNGQFRYWKRGTTAPVTGTTFNNGSVTLTFGSANTAPTVTPTDANGSPDFTPAPDINHVLIGTIDDPDGITAAQVSAAIMGTAPGNVPSFSIEQNGANQVRVFVTYEIANSDLAGGPSSFMVKITANDGVAPAVQGTALVNLVPAPGAAALLGLGGLLAARRRRTA